MMAVYRAFSRICALSKDTSGIPKNYSLITDKGKRLDTQAPHIVAAIYNFIKQDKSVFTEMGDISDYFSRDEQRNWSGDEVLDNIIAMWTLNSQLRRVYDD